jgi:DNA-binding transcriptional ArsR family regulator
MKTAILAVGNSDGSSSNKRSDRASRGYIDPRFKRLLWYLIGSTRGGINRARILELINSHPAKANQIAQELNLDDKTVIHHLDVLTQNGLVITDNKDKYGATYFLTPIMVPAEYSINKILFYVWLGDRGSTIHSTKYSNRGVLVPTLYCRTSNKEYR